VIRVPEPPAGALPNVNLPGRDYANVTLPQPDPAACQAACKADGRCAAWTYVLPGVQGPQARCWLKNAVPAQTPDGCCVSGIERAPVQARGSPMLTGVDMPGSDYRSFDLPAADAALCQSACRGEARCAAWTYVNPGVQARSARCWLKTRVPQRITHSCCTSGIERP
jgi:hypothetical protein